jgi:hypothetical protein
VNAGAGRDAVQVDGNESDANDFSVTINGGDGDDSLTLDPVDATTASVTGYIDGGGGDDSLEADNAGMVTLIGGDGLDAFDSNGMFGADALHEAVFGGDGNDTLFADGDTVYSIYDGGFGSNTIDYHFHADSTPNDNLYLLNMTGGFLTNVNTVIGGSDLDGVICNNNGDTITYPDALGNGVTITGGSGNDVININDASRDTDPGVVVNGNGGNDQITVTGSANVSVNGGAGNDVIHVRGNFAPVTVDGGADFDTAYTDPGTTVSNVESLNPDVTTKLAGTTIGTAGSYQNDGNTIAKVFDGNVSTFFNAPAANGDWVGLNLGSAKVAKTVKFAPRAGWESRMVGGKIQASNTANFSSGVVTLLTISSKPASGVLTTLLLNNSAAFQYYRYIGANGTFCNISELEFDG